MAIRMTTEEFVEKATIAHGKKYDYSQVEYVNAHTKVRIGCPVHGAWEQKPNNHLNGKGCGKCAASILKTTEDILLEFLSVHGTKYDYSDVKYAGADVAVKIRCTVHDYWFDQTPRVHKRGGGCPICASGIRSEKKRLTLEDVKFKLRECFGESINLDNVKITQHNPVYIETVCKHGHKTNTELSSFIRSRGCSECSGYTKGNVEILLKKFRKVHGDTYDYSLLTEHTGQKVDIICKKHGAFSQAPSSHLAGSGCPSCGRQDSKQEVELFEIISSMFPDTVRRTRTLIGKELDIYVPSKSFAIEFNGLYWHSDNPQNNVDARNRHKEKTDLCKGKGIHLFHLFEDDWLNRKDTVIHTIKHLLGVSEKKVYARKTNIKTRTLSEVRDFYNAYHMQGAPQQGFIVYCLFDNEDIVAAMTFSKPSSERGNTTDGRYELLRYACKYSVVGGASKLLKAFIKDHKPNSIVSYSDDSMFCGEMYNILGFKVVGKTKPDYKVIVGKERKHKSGFRRENLQKMLSYEFDPNLSERDNCHANGLYRIYNCGLTKWELNLLDNSTNL